MFYHKCSNDKGKILEFKPFATPLSIVPQSIRDVYRSTPQNERLPLPRNFFAVNEKVWRSAKPSAFEVGFLSGLGDVFSTIIDLSRSNGGDLKKKADLAKTNGFDYFCVNLAPEHPPSSTQIKEIFDIIDNAPKKVLLHCYEGVDRTGIVSALIRIKDGFDPKLAIKEMISAGHNPSKFPELIEYLKQFI